MQGPSILWLLFISWLVHDLEEILNFARFDPRTDPRLRRMIERRPRVKSIVHSRSVSQRENTLAISLMGLLILGATAIGYFKPDRMGMMVYGIFLGGYFLHTFTHLAQTILLRKYTPGVVTALAVVLPASLLIYRTLARDQLLTGQEIVVTALLGILIFVPLAVLVHQTARALGKLGPR
jgi:hypothetical protein